MSCIAQNNSSVISEKDGNIGIGTQNPDEKLTVKGKIHTQEVLVDLNGAVAPDYVFQKYYTGSSALKKDYTLISLSDLDTYLKTHHHLPDIPSAETLDKEGLSLKEMNLMLLQKVEELVVYTLEQQKEINSLREALEVIQKKQ
jgi:hypothetical protein